MSTPPISPGESLRPEPPTLLVMTEPVEFGDGFFAEEFGPNREPFRWMSERGRLSFAESPFARFLELGVHCEFRDGSQSLICNGTPIALAPDFGVVSLEIPAGLSSVTLTASKIFPGDRHTTDRRTLSARVFHATLHADPSRHERVSQRYANTIANLQEMLSGRTSLTSTPRNLGIDMYGACNVKPPCVYCEWDFNKRLEGDFVDAPFGLETLAEWGPFFDNSTQLVNCSIGEPFMMKNIDELLDAFGDGGKTLEMTTNGQILTDRNIQKLLGRPIHLYISLDAATAGTYAKLRNNRFDALLANVRRLIDAKGGPGHLPHVYLVFMPMKVNEHELDDFIRICAELGADQLVLRPLNYAVFDKLELNWTRAGYSFVYKDELLPFDRLVWISGRTNELCRQLGVSLSDQMDFGSDLGGAFHEQFEAGRRSVRVEPAPAVETAPAQPALPPPAPVDTVPAATSPSSPMAEAHMPACTEPWKSLYILRRGVFPCCYGGEPVAPMDQYRSAWNSPIMQDIRRDLTNGRFHKYCLDSPACPIVRKLDQAHQLSWQETLMLRSTAIGARVDRHWQRTVRAVLWSYQWSVIRTRKILTEPGYVSKQVKRVFGGRRP